jgi:hypothetical protein
VFLRDIHFGEPATSSLRYASDLVPSKQGTDIALNGSVHAGNRTAVLAGFRVGQLEKVLTAFGPRQWMDSGGKRMSEPAPFANLPLRYEHAFGGSYTDERGKAVHYGQNPVGMGFAVVARPRDPLPLLEYQGALVHSLRDRPPPACLGFIPAGWVQRSVLAGTFDDAWAKNRRPLFPKNFDQRFYNAVPQDQVLLPGLKGGRGLNGG